MRSVGNNTVLAKYLDKNILVLGWQAAKETIKLVEVLTYNSFLKYKANYNINSGLVSATLFNANSNNNLLLSQSSQYLTSFNKQEATMLKRYSSGSVNEEITF